MWYVQEGLSELVQLPEHLSLFKIYSRIEWNFEKGAFFFSLEIEEKSFNLLTYYAHNSSDVIFCHRYSWSLTTDHNGNNSIDRYIGHTKITFREFCCARETHTIYRFPFHA